MRTEITQVLAFKYIVKDAVTGEVYENTYGEKFIEVLIGHNQILPALEKEILNIPIGEERKIFLAKAYGVYDENVILHIPRNQVGNIPLKKGMTLYAKGKKGETLEVRVLSFDEQRVSIDHNHPMAGKDLIFKVKVVNLRSATAAELEHGHIRASEDACGCGSGCGCH